MHSLIIYSAHCKIFSLSSIQLKINTEVDDATVIEYIKQKEKRNNSKT